MFIRNCWYVAGWDTEVPQDAMLARTLLNEPVLLYRDTQGRAVALENRCCHRAAPLTWDEKKGTACVACTTA
jgi:phenylpropionate dioxygenase-like ring-hydroxylating dioxygenase large terminal subunit